MVVAETVTFNWKAGMTGVKIQSRRPSGTLSDIGIDLHCPFVKCRGGGWMAPALFVCRAAGSSLPVLRLWLIFSYQFGFGNRGWGR